MLIGASVLLVSGGILAQKSKTASASIEWQKGKRLAPTRRETYKLATGTTVTANPASALEVQSKVPLPTSIDGLAPFAHAAQLTTGRIDVFVDTKQKPATRVFIYEPRRTTVLIRGGKVSVIAGRPSMSVGVYEGKEASVGIGSTWKHVAPGYMLTVSPEAPSGAEAKLPSAPRSRESPRAGPRCERSLKMRRRWGSFGCSWWNSSQRSIRSSSSTPEGGRGLPGSCRMA